MRKLILIALMLAGCGGTPESDTPMQVGRKGGYTVTLDGRGVNPRCCGLQTAPDGGADLSVSPDFQPAPNNLTLPGELAKDPGPYTGR